MSVTQPPFENIQEDDFLMKLEARIKRAEPAISEDELESLLKAVSRMQAILDASQPDEK